jgi:aspartate/methionine/tyrosine aminotransferase
MQYDVHVTAGANQGFTNIVLALVDAADPVVLFAPYYFNHLM